MRFLPLLLAFAACAPRPLPGPARATAPTFSAATMARARAIAQRYPIVDGHVDLPYRLTHEPFADVVADDTLGDFSFGRARAGGLDAPFMSIYIAASYQDRPGAAFAKADSLIDSVEALVARAPDKFVIARGPDDVEKAHREGKIALPLGMENGAPIGSPADLRHFYERGVRYVSLTHGKDNRLGDSSYDTSRTNGGLTPLGAQIVREMNRLGVLVDLAHVSDSTAFQILRIARAPAIASHSSMRHFTPGWERNMSDELARALAANGGVVMINFGSQFLKSAYETGEATVTARVEAEMQRRGLTDHGSREAAAIYYQARRDAPTGTVEDVADHIDYAVRLVGIAHVGLGSDFDGVTALPAGLTDVSMYPNLVAVLLSRGYAEGDIAKILGGNLLRVWREVEQAAE